MVRGGCGGSAAVVLPRLLDNTTKFGKHFINAISVSSHYKYSKLVAFSDVRYWFNKDHAFSFTNNPVASAAV